jgi:hypothetical protein
MSTLLKLSGYLTLASAILIALYVLSIDYMEYKFIYFIAIIFGSLPVSLGAILTSRIYEKVVEGKEEAREKGDTNYVKNRNSQRDLY